jgi:outer membrane receptor protein involved in Fe transport
VNEESLTQALYQPNAAERTALAAAGFTGVPAAGLNAANTPFPSFRCIANVLLNDEPGEKCNGLINRTRTGQHNYGFSGQFTLAERFLGLPNQFTAGVAYDAARVRFNQSTELGFLNPDRSVTGTGAFADSITGGTIDGEPLDNRVDLDSTIRTWSVFAMETITFANVWHVTVSGRYNSTTLHNRDNINPGGGGASLDGDHRYSRLNPAAGLSYAPSRVFTGYVSYNEGSRAPTAIELGCANPAQPCRLPNAMAGDPPLDQVVTRTWETGLRTTLPFGTHLKVSLFRAENSDDILFVSAPNTAQSGFFKNFGRTRREGLELSAAQPLGRLTLAASYTYLDATFQSLETLPGAANSSNSAASANAANRGTEGGTIQVQPGDRIPLIPQHLLKAYADYQVTPSFLVSLNTIVVGSSFARGNENNAHQPDGTFYLGSGKSGGYAVFNLGSQWQIEPRLMLYAQMNNLLDRHYSTGALLGATAFTSSGNFIARPFANPDAIQHATFYAPGAPRSVWVGLRYTFERPRQL